MLNDTLVIAMGEFGRTPNLGTQGSTDGRNHWPVVMSMAVYVILDFEYPRFGLIRIDKFDRVLVDVRAAMK